uniref:Venom peptide 3 n=1 Tax=Tityus serrulatus TaxID=6887 RepID=NDB4T_TITSE|nr:RecName: Full=Venom peptide 3; Contains: RecName: Full=Venom peptide 4; Contains: RecName: Full=Venom peptide 5 [Tityus serrulatus]
YDRYEVVYR